MFKEIKALLKENSFQKPISLELFEKIRKLKICEAPKDSEHCANKHIVERTVSEEIDNKKFQKNNNYRKDPRNDKDYGNNNNNNRYNNKPNPHHTQWKKEDSEEKKKLIEMAAKVH